VDDVRLTLTGAVPGDKMKPFPLIIFLLMASQTSAITVEEILRNNEKAMGGAEAINAVETIMTVSELSTGGLVGSDTVASMKPDRYYEDIDLGLLRQISIADGDIYWASDLSGNVRPAAGAELDILEMASYFGNSLYLYPDEGQAQLTGENDENYVVTYEVIEDFQVEVFFDKTTWLITRSEVDTDFGKSVTEYAGYREVSGGIYLPHEITQTTGPQIITSVVSEVYINERVSPGDFVPSQVPDSDVERIGASEDIPIKVSDNLVFIDVSLDGSPPARFLLDTGAGMTVIDYNAVEAEELEGGEIPAMGVGGMEQTNLMIAESLEVGGAKLFEPTVAVMDLSNVSGAVGETITGILGYDFISRFTIKIDFENETLAVVDKDDFTPQEETIFLPIEFISNIPLVDAAVDGYAGKFVLDSGNSDAVVLFGPFVRENRLFDLYENETIAYVAGFGGTKLAYPVRMDELVIGGFVLDGPVVLLSTAEAAGFAMTSAIGNLGGAVLSRFTVYLDYPRNRIGLVPNARFGEPFNSRTGLK
jgi:hypothetical protein